MKVIKYSNSQQRAIRTIDQIKEHFGIDRWFIKEEVVGVSYNTMMALVNKGYLRTQYFGNVDYYQINAMGIPK